MLRFLTTRSQTRRTLVFASATHVWSDLFFALFIPLLVLIKLDPEMELSFTEVGFLKSTYVMASAILQVPSGLLAERLGEGRTIVTIACDTGMKYLSTPLYAEG